MSSLLKKRLLQKRREKLNEHLLENAEAVIAAKNKFGVLAEEFEKKFSEKNCALVATILDGDTGFQTGLCNLNFKDKSSKDIYVSMIAANIQSHAIKMGVSVDKLLGDIALGLSKYEEMLGMEG